MRILRGTLTGLATSIFISASASAQDLSPYRCPEPSDVGITKTWMASEARESLYNSGGSAARIERGKTYGAFMDAFWSNLDHRFLENSPETVAELFDGIGESYKHAYATSAAASLKHGITPQLFIDSAFRNRLPNGRLNENDIALTPADLETSPLSQNVDLQKLLPLNNTLDEGIEISIRFMPTWGDYMHFPIAKGLGQHTNLTNQDPIESLLGFKREDDHDQRYGLGEANIKDSVICRQVYN